MIWFKMALLPTGWAKGVRITTDMGMIRKIEVDTRPSEIDEVHAYGLAGLSNVHSHAFQLAMAGLTETASVSSDSFWTWRELMYRFTDRIEPHHLNAIASQAYCKMLEAGFTRVGEFHYLHRNRAGDFYANKAAMAEAIGAAAAESGIGLTLLPVLYSFSNFGGKPPEVAQRRFTNGLDDYMSLLEQTRAALKVVENAQVGVAPHSLRATDLEQLRALAAHPGDHPIHIHVAEQTREVEDCITWSKRTPVDLLLDTVAVDDRWCLIHATHTTNAELQRIAGRGAVIGLCPITEANLGDGIFDASGFRGLSGKFGIGSDSNVSISAVGELSLLEYGQRLLQKNRNVMGSPGESTGRCLFEAALQGGHQALGQTLDGIAPGSPCDLISLRPVRVTLPLIDGDVLLNLWIFGGSDYEVDTVWVAGRKRVESGRHLDRERISAHYDRTIRHLLD